eukprot:987219-Rhodomonas_salina.2
MSIHLPLSLSLSRSLSPVFPLSLLPSLPPSPSLSLPPSLSLSVTGALGALALMTILSSAAVTSPTCLRASYAIPDTHVAYGWYARTRSRVLA